MDDGVSTQSTVNEKTAKLFFSSSFGLFGMRDALQVIERLPMPYLRLHLPEVPIQQKRVIAQKLIEITMHAFRLRPEERYQVSVEFISEPKPSIAGHFEHAIPRDSDALFEVMGHDITEEKKRAFKEETAAMLSPLLPARLKMRIARLLGVKPDESRQIAFQFGELSPAVSEPFVVHSGSQAA